MDRVWLPTRGGKITAEFVKASTYRLVSEGGVVLGEYVYCRDGKFWEHRESDLDIIFKKEI